MKRFLLCFSVVVLFGCGPKLTYITSNETKELGHIVDKEYSAEVGANMIESVKGRVFDAIQVTSESQKVYTKDLAKDEIFLKKAKSEEFDLYYAQKSSQYGVALSTKGGPAKLFFIGGGLNYYGIKKPLTFEKIEFPDPEVKYFKQQFIYNGKSGNSIKFTYREYANDLARPAFSQDLQYDLSESNIIGFRGMRVEVVKATNIEIIYKILKKFE